MKDKMDAYCHFCEFYICDQRVTFEECCDTCGNPVEYHSNSDIDNIDSAFKKIIGVTKAEHDSIIAEIDRKRNEELDAYNNNIPNLTIEWIEKGNKILDEEYREYWAKIVPIRLSDLYRGMGLGCCLDIVDALNKGVHLDEAKSIIEDQGHSGMSFGLVKSMVKAFCKRGNDFFHYV